MKSKYFNISENENGTYRITTQKGNVIDVAAHGYEINPRQPRFIKIRHDGGAWCSLFNERGCALKDTMWVNDVVMNDDGSYRVQEYIHDGVWKYYDNGVSARRFWDKYAVYFSGTTLVIASLMLNVSSNAQPAYDLINKKGEKQPMPTVQKVLPVTIQKLSPPKERIRE